jgi:hypothetical protein
MRNISILAKTLLLAAIMIVLLVIVSVMSYRTSSQIVEKSGSMY